MLLEKLAGRPVTSEVPLPTFARVPAPPAVARPAAGDHRPGDRRRARPARESGRHRGPGGHALRRLRDRGPERRSIPAQYDNVHRGYDTTYVKQDPHRLVPVDVARELEQAGAVGKLHEVVYSTTGVATTLAHSQRMGREIAAKLQRRGWTGSSSPRPEAPALAAAQRSPRSWSGRACRRCRCPP